jgi:O-antigen ligase
MRDIGISAAFGRAIRSHFWLLCVDIYPALVAASIPWSTTAVAVFMVVWFIVLLPTIDPRAFLHSLTQPSFWLPLAFFALATIGVLWADAAWPERLHGISPSAKLLAIPFLLYHFERSKRAHWVLVAFLFSCTILMLASWLVLYEPSISLTHWRMPGVAIKNTIDQSQEFTICFFVLLWIAITTFRQHRFLLSLFYSTLAACFMATMVFAALSRTSLVCIAALLALFSFRYLSRIASTALIAATIISACAVWFSSPYLRYRVESIAFEYQAYRDANAVTSTGQRIEWWSRSLGFIREKPFFGSGTGSIKGLFERDGKVADWNEYVMNPHNQTMSVAIQWGIFGCLILYAMWFSHLALFKGYGMISWLGLIIVVQNFFGSLFNSHLFDFTEGWIYVLGVGVAGGAVSKRRGHHDSTSSLVKTSPRVATVV